MKKTLLTALAALMCLQAAPVLAENYGVNLPRKGSNVYKIDGKDIIIQTRYCYVYAYSEEAIFKASGYGDNVFQKFRFVIVTGLYESVLRLLEVEVRSFIL